MNPSAPDMKTFEAVRVLNSRTAMRHSHDNHREQERRLAGRRFRQHAGCHAGEVVHVLGEAPHFDGYWLVEAECGKRWAMRERVLRSRLHND